MAVWARDNAADVRHLAGQIATLDDLDSRTQASVDQVHTALGDSNSAALPAPLAEAGAQLSNDHPGMAERILELGARTDEIRRTEPPSQLNRSMARREAE